MKKYLVFCIILLLFTNFVSALTTTNLVGYFSLEDTDTNLNASIYDSTNDLNGLVQTGALVNGVSGKFGNAFQFNTSGRFYFSNDLYRFDANTPYSFCAWVTLDTNTDYQTIYALRGGSADHFILRLSDTNIIEYKITRLGVGATTVSYYDESILNNDFVFICTTFTGTTDTNNMSLYVGGAPVGRDTYTYGYVDLPSDDFDIGAKLGSWKFAGKMDEISYFKNRVLTDQEILEFYNGGSGQTYCQDFNGFAPTCSDIYVPNTVPDSNSQWNKDINVSFTCTDVGLGCNDLNYSINGGAWTDVNYSSDTYVVTLSGGDGNYIIQYFSTDVNGNVESEKISYHALDTTAPQTSISGNTYLTATVTSQTITLSCTDLNSGCENTEYMIDSNGTWFLYQTPFTISSDGNHQIDYNTTDKAGNQEIMNTSYAAVDSSIPTISDDINSGWQLVDSNIHLTCVDSDSGVVATWYRLDDDNTAAIHYGDWTAYDQNILLTNDGNFSIQYFCTNGAGLDSNVGTPDSNIALNEGGLPITPTSITPTTGAFTGTVTAICTAPSWIRDVNYAIDFNSGTDWNEVYIGSLKSYTLDLSVFPTDTNIFFKCKTLDGDKNSFYLENSTSIIANFGSGGFSMTNPVPSAPTALFSSSAPFNMTVTATSGVDYCVFTIYKNGISVGDFNGTTTAIDGNGVWNYTYSGGTTGDIIYSSVTCHDTTNHQATADTSTYSVSLSGGSGGNTGGGGTTVVYTTPPVLDLNFSPARYDVPFFYAPFTEPTARVASVDYILNQKIESCATDNPAFDCQVQEGYKIIVTTTYDDDKNFGKVISANIFGTNANGKVGATKVTIRVTNLAAYIETRFNVRADAFEPITNNPYIVKTQDGEVIGIRIIALAFLGAILIIGTLLVLWRTGRLSRK